MEEKTNSRAGIFSEHQLKGKVALLIDGAGNAGHSLAKSLAEHGADIAIVYRRAHAGQVRQMKHAVEAAGQRCLIIQSQTNDETFAKEVIRKTLKRLGRLDIFIDYSSLPDEQSGQVDDGDIVKRDESVKQPESLISVEDRPAGRDRMASPDHTNNQVFEPSESTRRSNEGMRIAQELVNKPIISINEGQEIGKIKDFYLDKDLTRLVAIYLGSEGLLSRKKTLIDWTDVVTLGQDAVLVKDADCVMETSEAEKFASYIRRDDIVDRPVDTPGGTKIGRIGDIILDNEARIAGFALSHTYVSGPIAQSRAIDRQAVVDTGNEDGVLTANLSQAEKADLQVSYEGFFGEPAVSASESQETATEA